jgi:hypothetical protein
VARCFPKVADFPFHKGLILEESFVYRRKISRRRKVANVAFANLPRRVSSKLHGA